MNSRRSFDQLSADWLDTKASFDQLPANWMDTASFEQLSAKRLVTAHKSSHFTAAGY